MRDGPVCFALGISRYVIRRNSKAAVFLQIAHAMIDEIKRGRLTPGTALPGSRELAESLEINRKTVIQAYAELEAQGWVTSARRPVATLSRRICRKSQ